MRRVAIRLTAVACVIGVAACTDSTAPRTAKTPPNAVNHTRYILASGEVLPSNCQDLGNGLWLCDESQSATAAAASRPTSDNNDAQ